MKCHQQKLTPAELEELLRAIRPCLDEKGKVLLESARVFTISKTTKIEQSKDNAGNFAYHVTRESAKGAGEVEIPKAIKFTVQIFDCCPETMELEFEPRFFWTESKDGVSMTYSFENPRVSIEIRKAKRECIEKYIKDIAAEIHYGSIEVSTQDDSWKYKANPLTDK
jgi:hypothetical protein